MLRNRLGDRVVVAVAALALVPFTLMACEPGARKRDIGDTDAGIPKPGPDPAARPEYSNRVAASIYVECTWHGRRWMYVTVMHNGEPRGVAQRQKKWTEDGPNFAGGRGSVSETWIAEPGDTVGIVCNPMDREDGHYLSCRVVHHNMPVDTNLSRTHKGVVCSYKVPGGPQ